MSLVGLSISSPASALYKTKLRRTGGQRTKTGNLLVSAGKFMRNSDLEVVGPQYQAIELFRHTSLKVGTVEKDQLVNGIRVPAGMYLIDPKTGNQLAGPFAPGTLRQRDKHTFSAKGVGDFAERTFELDIRRLRSRPFDLTPDAEEPATMEQKIDQFINFLDRRKEMLSRPASGATSASTTMAPALDDF